MSRREMAKASRINKTIRYLLRSKKKVIRGHQSEFRRTNTSSDKNILPSRPTREEKTQGQKIISDERIFTFEEVIKTLQWNAGQAEKEMIEISTRTHIPLRTILLKMKQ
ncbi:hypothetical protein NPIL_189491 [Nephila pilipes]|uniref:Uncharacterized protein n=1 Tax=Nephila pilipes TaxID=299642 RepID=A0A8X6TK05_NEPPI|nr:hypothetical protein NPIL_189491 [Nephila pilipes]